MRVFRQLDDRRDAVVPSQALDRRENLARPPVHDIDVPHQQVDDLQSIALCLASAQAPSSKLTRLVNRTMVEGGAPYRHCVGLPHYPPDSFDNDLTYPIKGNYERVNGTLWSC